MDFDPGRKSWKYGHEPFFPHHLLRQSIQLSLILALLVFLAGYAPPPTVPAADAYTVPGKITVQWYLLPARQFLLFLDKSALIGSWVPKFIGVLLQGTGALFLLFLPFMDKNPSPVPQKRPYAMRIGISLFVFYTVLTLWGYLS